jgi:hypothetical protein
MLEFILDGSKYFSQSKVATHGLGPEQSMGQGFDSS